MLTDSFSIFKSSDRLWNHMNQSHRLKILVLILFAAVPFLCVSADAGPPSKNGKMPNRSKAAREKPAEPQESINPTVYLMRDPLVQSELHLSGEQKEAVAELAIRVNEPLWRMRDLAPEAGIGSDDVKIFNKLLEPMLEKVLSSAQRERMDQIVLQSQGWAALGRVRIADQLKLASDQREAVARILIDAQEGLKNIRLQASAGKNVPELNRKIARIGSDLQNDLAALLTPAQRSQWDDLRGKPFELAKLKPMSALAPELREISAWHNSQPLTLEQLRGRVVALHFWTFG
jgi:hypothetical protein